MNSKQPSGFRELEANFTFISIGEDSRYDPDPSSQALHLSFSPRNAVKSPNSSSSSLLLMLRDFQCQKQEKRVLFGG